MKITYNEAMKEINKDFKSLGLQLKPANATFNGAKLFNVVDRDSGRILFSNFTLWSCYENMLSGYFMSSKDL